MSGKTMKENLQTIAIRTAINYVGEEPDKSIPKLLNWADKFDKEGYHAAARASLHTVVDNPDNHWYPAATPAKT